MNYIVVSPGHISFFEQSEQAWQLADDTDGRVFNTWGLIAHHWQESPTEAQQWYSAWKRNHPESTRTFMEGLFQ